ncbi:RNA polymerase III subunit RPC82 domain-containing protein [Hirsutella rhossiliensis]|uniref:DNA-directed RNA polymerase III subunit RPC3 n=1 Tax=Hirsutella rhossiliensis TaxID=111463 RepID=A0A9P8SM38_9HYPO|nr:RNA polymerase III subunit RPC82 domain-containing protein [Hirsutella rhossiliensis]KAH0966934.1 RNA polymerase III subunit RPC82 domain-containing protein [Hirsutella rhossiliensis]
MLQTKHAAELCALLVNDLFGELPSRVLAALFTKGRSSIAQLAQITSLSPRHLRNGLGVLIQQNLLFYYTDPDSRVTSYEANSDACYNLIRSGKILEVVESQHGTAGRDLVQTLMLLGYARVADLTHAFGSRAPKSNGHANGAHESASGLIESEDHLHMVLTRLIQDEIVETVRPDSFRNPAEVYREIEAEVTKTAPGERASRNKIEQHMQIVERFKTFRDQSRTLKRQLDQANGPVAKRRKLQNGNAHADDPFADDLAPLNPNIVVRVNHEKCLVQLRNQRLAQFASDTLGEATGKVYHALLELLTVQLARCRSDQLSGDQGGGQQVTVTSIEVYEHLDEGVNVQSGIGKAPRDKIDFHSAEKVRPSPLDCESDSDDSDGKPPVRGRAPRTITSGEYDESDGSSDDDGFRAKGSRSASRVNGDRQTKVKFEDEAASKDSRLDQMRQHLLLLAESRHRFVRHCGTNGRGQWTVDFGQLMESLREAELDAYIEQSFGRHGLRLTRILREKGKLDEKMLPSAALMKKSDVQGKMLAMQMAGLVDVQEVPKDNSRLANRTLFFWFFDGERTQSQLLDDVYKAMLRCLQTLQVERHKERNILSFVERKDVKGKEEEVMTAEHYNKYNRHLEEQAKLLGQVMRLDDMVAVVRDY